jgi:hypothetical protein
MRTTLDIDRLLRLAKQKASELGSTLTRFIEDALRAKLQPSKVSPEPFRFEPVIRSGVPVAGVDFEDRDALYERMEGRS